VPVAANAFGDPLPVAEPGPPPPAETAPGPPLVF
jgi:hypothetical protein